jgi:hypothetical protein
VVSDSARAPSDLATARSNQVHQPDHRACRLDLNRKFAGEAEPVIRIVLFFQFVTAMPMESRFKAIS